MNQEYGSRSGGILLRLAAYAALTRRLLIRAMGAAHPFTEELFREMRRWALPGIRVVLREVLLALLRGVAERRDVAARGCNLGRPCLLGLTNRMS
jgi:hypothetical protein